MKNKFFLTFFIPLALQADPTVSVSKPVFPNAIQQQLDQNFPGWRLPKVPGGSSVVMGDFDRNGFKDVALNILVGPGDSAEQILVIYLQKEQGYEQKILESRGADALIALRIVKGSVHEQDPTGVRKYYHRESIEVQAPEGDRTYTVENGEPREADSF